jgi:hypothetical protein
MCLPQRTGLDEMPTGRCRAPASGMRLSAAGQSHTPPIDKQRPKRPQKLPNRKKTRELRYPLSSICSAICYVNVLFETGESIKSLGEFIWTSSGRLTLKLTRRCGECHLAAALPTRTHTDLIASRHRATESWAIGLSGKDAIIVVSSWYLLTHMHTWAAILPVPVRAPATPRAARRRNGFAGHRRRTN